MMGFIFIRSHITSIYNLGNQVSLKWQFLCQLYTDFSNSTLISEVANVTS